MKEKKKRGLEIMNELVLRSVAVVRILTCLFAMYY